MTLTCYRCKQPFDVREYNRCRALVPCPTCGTHNAFAECVTRTHGAALGTMAARIVEHLGAAGSRRKNANVAAWAGSAWDRLERAVLDASATNGSVPLRKAA